MVVPAVNNKQCYYAVLFSPYPYLCPPIEYKSSPVIGVYKSLMHPVFNPLQAFAYIDPDTGDMHNINRTTYINKKHTLPIMKEEWEELVEQTYDTNTSDKILKRWNLTK